MIRYGIGILTAGVVIVQDTWHPSLAAWAVASIAVIVIVIAVDRGDS